MRHQPPFPASATGSGEYIPLLRSELAHKWFPELSRKQSGILMARIIATTPVLHATLVRLGYVPNRQGYTAPMVEAIDRYLQANIDFIDIDAMLITLRAK